MSDPDPLELLEIARTAQRQWTAVPIRERTAIVRRFRDQIVNRVDDLVSAVQIPQRVNPRETLAAEVVPLADACRFLNKNANRLLAPRKLGWRDRPLWMTGVRTEIHRDPLGVVLILGTWNYPLLLTGVQMLQALVAGNAVFVKPGRDAVPVTNLLAEMLFEAGLDRNLLHVFTEDPTPAKVLIETGVDKIVLTGSATTGKAVCRNAVETMTPTTMELSGCDAVFVQRSADWDRVFPALRFGLSFNSGATCIAPRRIFVPEEKLEEFEERLLAMTETLPRIEPDPQAAATARKFVRDTVENGATLLAGDLDSENLSESFPLIVSNAHQDMPLLNEDVFAPVLSLIGVPDDQAALATNRRCAYALGATVFGEGREAEILASQIDAGTVVVNDMLAPTADPRAGFGGRRLSGHGVTRGDEGLLQMTAYKAVFIRKGRFAPHLTHEADDIEDLLRAYLQTRHASSWFRRCGGIFQSMRAGFEVWKRRQKQPDGPQDASKTPTVSTTETAS
ncbi:aldehyde dehydrogenase family protein [Thalassoroseus pseudoceratinae]|uniref:aldehyde dehydrogenase family protein n=1 Tax=Thalassoroseus pseudoceratinae TaxID=2713176 RepID=UPI00141E2FA8|nr:aldehyde dehydrogenase family protein [Thalassoroseus pseudoceratinae]